ncbi:MAG: DNA polymerase III subunit gamma/tau [Planctomycetes bacterium]|nr:DNA polymerase III subunit gamma/tau [Planctomycetota bacterium]
MAYRVLARTYRSRTFDEVVGQAPVATTLTNAIRSDRVHHGYLFTGTRGVGKTTMARILAKALNCLSYDAPTTTPCGQCDSCVLVAEGEDVDVVEIDAASNTGVDNIRELRSNATLCPSRSRFKIYIIDEVHMLSAGAFNALLKILEEPPPHVKFILATTEIQKVPATIQSRCQQFDFQAIDTAAITKHLASICKLEKVRADDDVLRRIARLGQGSMRDAMSLLDKLMSFEAKHLTLAVADEIIPPPHDELASAVIECVAQSDAAGALQALDRALQSGRTVDRFCDHLIEHVRTLMLLRVCGSDTDLVEIPGSLRPALIAQSEQFDPPTFVYMITLLEELRRNVKASGAARALADAAVVRLAMSRQFSDIQEWIDGLAGDGGKGSGSTSESSSKKNGGDRPRQDGHRGLSAAGPTPISEERSVATTAVMPSRGRAGDAGASGGRAELQPEPMATSTTRVASEQWRRAARDPLVQRVKEAVDGTIVGVRSAPKGNASIEPPAATPNVEETIEPEPESSE